MSETIPRAGFTLLIRCCLFYANNQPRIRGDHSIDSTRDAYQGDHPRMRGDHMTLDRLAAIAEGSSPHARGPLQRVAGDAGATGIIPACAGTTASIRPDAPLWWDHPRMRGDHSSPVESMMKCSGSSPHARGPRQRAEVREHALRIIPACAGTTPSARARPSWSRDHPRMRGDH